MAEQDQFNWIFPSNDGGMITGANNTSDELFKDSPKGQALAREMCQNSLDAHREGEPPVMIEFKKFSISPSLIPDINQLVSALTKCQEAAQQNDVVKKKFIKALELLKKSKIPVLRISDFNTTGLTGSGAFRDTPWVNLVKAVGSSNKTKESGGSFGMGKATAFSTSDLNTVFFSTYDMEGVKVHQGVARLISYQIDDKGGLFTQGPGYYGRRDEQSRVILPANGEFHLDPSFRREKEQFGTDIYILGFNDNFEDLKISVLDGFFYAIHSEKLIVKLDDEVIDKNTIEGHINSLKADNTMVKEYFACLKNPDLSDFEDIKLKDSEGTYHLYLKMGENYHCQIAQIRSSGMKIFDDKKPVDSIINYCGILVAEGVNLNGLLKASENPAHTNWTVYRAKEAGYDNARDVIIEAKKNLVSRAMAQYKPKYQERVPLYINRRLAYSDLTKKSEDKQDEKNSLIFDKNSKKLRLFLPKVEKLKNTSIL